MEKVISKKRGLLDSFFGLSESGTSVKQEFVGGLTTFLTMAYIIFVNPSILGATGMDKGALITVTCLASFIGTLLAALWANVPFALAPGMGLNAFFTYTLVMGRGVSWETALGVVFLSGIFFFVMALAGVREKIAAAIPTSLRTSVTVGIGLFITFIGLQGLGFIVDNPATLVGIGKFTTPLVLGIIGLVVTIGLELKGVKGGILIGIIATTVLGVVLGEVSLPKSFVSTPPSIAPIAFKLDIASALKISLIGPIFSFMFVDLFDSLGTVIACSKEAGLLGKDGKVKNLGKILHTDVTATIAGSILGTSTTTCYIESASGIAAGARTGLSSLFTAFLFLAATLFTPIIGVVPAFATAPALIMVGIYMFKNIGDIDLKDLKTVVPAFITIIFMPLTYSISMGMSLGFVSYIIIHAITGDFKKLNPTLIVIGILSLLNLLVH